MKKSLPVPVIIAVVVLALALVGFVLYRGAAGPPEFEAPKTTKTIPLYVWDGMTPEMQAKMKAQGYEPADIKPQGQPTAPR